MQLIGYLDSPYVRRVAITMRLLGIDFSHKELSIFRSYDEFRTINPLVKVPTLICDDGHVLVDSTLIIDYLESISPSRSLVPLEPNERRDSLEYTGVALVAMEKVVQLIYELKHRPAEKQHEPWQIRVREQLTSACELLEQIVVNADPWLFGTQISQADVTSAVAWRFVQHAFPEIVEEGKFPNLVNFSQQAENQPEFIACPLSW